MPSYRLYHLDGTGKVASAEWVDAAGDAAAIEAAKERCAAGPCELWLGQRLVTRLERGRN